MVLRRFCTILGNRNKEKSMFFLFTMFNEDYIQKILQNKTLLILVLPILVLICLMIRCINANRFLPILRIR